MDRRCNAHDLPDLVPDLKAQVPQLRGRLLANEPLAPLTWFRVGGPARCCSCRRTKADLAYFLAHLPAEIPVTVVGLGSNLIVRDGGVPGVVIRLGRGFTEIKVEGARIRAGTAVPDVRVARAAQEAGLRGARLHARHSRRDRRRAAHERRRLWPRDQGCADRGARRRSRRQGARLRERRDALHLSPLRRARGHHLHRGAVPGTPGDPAAIAAEMDKITESREATQPIKSRTGGSTFKNPPGHKAWQLIDAAGCRGLNVGGAQVSEMHCNFLINRGNATAADIETLGETVRERVREKSGVELEWEIKRIGVVGDSFLLGHRPAGSCVGQPITGNATSISKV